MLAAVCLYWEAITLAKSQAEIFLHISLLGCCWRVPVSKLLYLVRTFEVKSFRSFAKVLVPMSKLLSELWSRRCLMMMNSTQAVAAGFRTRDL